MKRLVFRNILMYVISFALFIVPLFFFDYFSPLYLQWIAPLFLIYANVSCDLKQKFTQIMQIIRLLSGQHQNQR